MTKSEQAQYEKLLAKHGDATVTIGRKSYPKAKIEYMRWKCLTDLYYLGTEVLGLGRVKKRVYPKFHRWLCNCMTLDGDKMIIVPRKHGKTTWMKAYIVQRVLRSGGKIRILLLSKTEMLSVLNLKSIKRFLARPLLNVLFPDVVPDPGKDFKNWSKNTSNELTMREDPNSVSNEPQIMALGSMATFVGTAVDLIIMDDYIDDETCRSVTKMMKVEEEWGYLQPILDDGGEIMITGTFYHYNDLYNKIIKEGHIPKNRVFVRAAIENGKIIYPTMFNKQRLDKLRKINNYLYSCQYMSNPIPKEDQIFPAPQPTCQVIPKDKDRKEYKVYILLDPAPTVSKSSDATGYAIAKVNRRDIIYYVEAGSLKKDGAGKADWLIQKVMQYAPQSSDGMVKVGIEYGLQRDLDYIIQTRKADFENRMRTRVKMQIEPIKVDNSKSKSDRVYLSLGAFCKRGQVQILDGPCRELVLQMDTFTGKGNEKDDVVDAASMLFPLVKHFGYAMSKVEKMKHGDTYMDIIERYKKRRSGWRKNFVA